jgi:superfamily I DNA/RNA helicase
MPAARASAAAPAADGADPFNHPDARRRFWSAADETELKQALDQPWDEWLVFLHPSQRSAVERSFNGPARVSGAAGTGKSVVAMHRAAQLAKLSTGGRVFLTTFSKVLGRRLADGMDKLLGTSGDARGRVHVAHLHAYAMETVGTKRKEVRIAGNEDIAAALRAARGDLDAAITDAFLIAEWEAVIDFWGIRDWESYRTIVRAGRGAALTPARRKRLWDVFAGAQAALAKKELMTWGDLCDEARAIIEGGARPFRHVVVDEAQDFGPRELKLIAALAPPGPRSLFFAGDTGQRIYRWPFSWLAAGIDVRGRAARLRVNYRTSEQVRRFSDSLLPDTIEEIDGENETRRTLSLLHGPEPEIIGGNAAADEADTLARWLAGLRENGVTPGQIAIFARTRHALDRRAKPALARAGLEGGWIGGNDDPPDDRVALGTLHAAKGLEFRAVALVACSGDQLPLPVAVKGADDDDARAAVIERERQLLYVGCTRAREWLLITYSGEPSSFLLGPASARDEERPESGARVGQTAHRQSNCRCI